MEFTSAQFQEWFLDRRPDMYFKVFRNEKEIHSTKDNVLWNYDNADKEINIKTNFIPLPSDKDRNRIVVSGSVRTTENIPVPEIVVEAFDKKVGKKPASLGKKKTNEKGFYQIDYTKQVEKVVKGKQIDLFVQCYDKKGAILDKSDLLIDASKGAAIDLTVPKEVRRAPTAFAELWRRS